MEKEKGRLETYISKMGKDDLTERRYTYYDMLDAFYAGGDYRESLMPHMVEQYGAGSVPTFLDYMHRKFLNDDSLNPKIIKENPLNNI
jgi:hypothetical protein